MDKTQPTQVHRALQQWGIALIPAYSPEARGRSERVFRTLRDRLPQEWALAGLTDRVAANRYLAEQFVPVYNQRFAVPAAEPGTAFVPWMSSNLIESLGVQEDRVVANDNTVRYQGRSLQIPTDPYRFHYVKATVRVHEYPDGTRAVFQGPRCLARDQTDGRLIETEAASARRKKPIARSRDRPIVDPRAIVRERISAQR